MTDNTLRQFQQVFKIVFDLIDDAIGIYELESETILISNRKMVAIFGNFQTEVLPLNSFCLETAPYTCQDFLNWINKTIVEGPQRLEWKSKDNHGTLLWVDMSLQQLSIDQKDYVVITIRNVSSFIEVKEALLGSQQMLKVVINNFPGLVSWKDKQSVYLGANKSFAKAAGLSDPAEVIGKTDFDLPWVRAEAEAYQSSDWQVIKSGKPIRHIIESQFQADGSVAWLDTNITPLLDSQNNSMGVLVTSHDVTEYKWSEEALRESEARFRSYFDAPIAGIAISSPDREWLEVNDHLCHLLGYSKEELLKKTWDEVTHPDDLDIDKKQFIRVMSGKIDGFSTDKRFVRGDGKIVWTSMSARCVRLPRGAVDYFVVLLLDISERKYRERELETIASVSFALRNVKTSSEMSAIVLDQVIQFLGADAGSIELVDAEKGGSRLKLRSVSRRNYPMFICCARKTWTHIFIKPKKHILIMKPLMSRTGLILMPVLNVRLLAACR